MAETKKGAPKWMVTFGDAVTLLLTFFVLLMTFSGPEEEALDELRRGFSAGIDSFGIYRAKPGADAVIEKELKLLMARMDVGTSQYPEKYARLAVQEMQKFHEDIDVEELPDEDKLKAIKIRVPLDVIFGPDGRLSEQGAGILDRNAVITRAKNYSIVVRVEAGAKGTDYALIIADYLRERVSPDTREIGLSNDFQPRSPLKDGECLILLIEV